MMHAMNPMKRLCALITAVCITVASTGCATTTPQGETQVRVGTVEQITAANLEGDNQLGIGAVLGAAAGFGIGSLIGRGTGQDVARVLGTLGGAYAGSTAQRRYGSQVPGQHITVRLDNGVLVQITQQGTELRTGDRVQILGAGSDARVQRI